MSVSLATKLGSRERLKVRSRCGCNLCARQMRCTEPSEMPVALAITRPVQWVAWRAAVVGRTRREAEEKYREYRKHASVEGALAHFSSSTGLDFSRYEQDEPIRYVKNDAINSAVETLTTMSPEPWTLRRIVGRMALGSRNPAIVGSVEEVADDLIAWVEETDIDGFNLSRIVTPESLEDFVDLVVPILQERGAYKRDYLPGTLREKLFGRARLLPPSHPVGAHRPPATCNSKSS